jgi:hypothetical protein
VRSQAHPWAQVLECTEKVVGRRKNEPEARRLRAFAFVSLNQHTEALTEVRLPRLCLVAVPLVADRLWVGGGGSARRGDSGFALSLPVPAAGVRAKVL